MTNDTRHAVIVEEGARIPDGFRFPALDEMKNGDERCDHPCDVEHSQFVDGTLWCTSIVWTTDGGVGTPGLELPMIGCQWIGSVEFLDECVSFWDTGWREQVSVILDCDADTPDKDAIGMVYALLEQAVRHMDTYAG